MRVRTARLDVPVSAPDPDSSAALLFLPWARRVIPVGQMGPLRPVVQARWHPLSETSSHLALLSTDASLRCAHATCTLVLV